MMKKEQAPKNPVDVEALDIEVEGSKPEEESTPMNPRMETRSTSRISSPFTPPKIHPHISRNDEVSTSKKSSSRVIKNHPNSNIIGSLDEGLYLRKGNILLANHVTYHYYLAQFEPKRVDEAFQVKIGLSLCMRSWSNLWEMMYGN